MRPENYWVTKIESLWYGDKIGTSTGFFYKHGQTLGLVTNWHVFSNKSAVSNTHLCADHKMPNAVRFVASVIKASHKSANFTGHIIEFREFTLPLLEDGKSLWWQHFGYRTDVDDVGRVDIAVLPLDKLAESLEMKESIFHFSANVIAVMNPDGKPQYIEYAYPKVGSDVFILGYPLGIASQGLIPTWKRGSIASEPLAHLDGNLPVFLVDSVTRNGMSGAPILYFGSNVTTSDGAPVSPQYQDADTPWLVGIHAGSRGSSKDELEMTLSRGWNRHLIDEVFMCQVPGDEEPTGIAPWP